MIIATTLAIVSCTQASDFNDISKGLYGSEVYIFGFTRHSNRNVNYNEKNYGFGLGVFRRIIEDNVYSNIDATFIGGTYIDSYNERAKFLMPGLRFNFGNINTFHSSLGVNAGYFVGSDMVGFGIIPCATIGFNRFDICVTGFPNHNSGEQQNENSKYTSRKDQQNENAKYASSGFISVFAKITLATW